MHFFWAARFARVEGEVRAEDFLEGGFFQRKVFRLRNFAHSLRLVYPLAQGFEPMRGITLKLEDLFLKLLSLVYERAPAREILAAPHAPLPTPARGAGAFLV